MPKLGEPVRHLGPLDASLSVLIKSVKQQGFEGLVAKRLESHYEPGLRSGAWLKMRVNQAQEFVISGYTIGNPFDALIFGDYEKGQLMYAGRTRNGFTPVVRAGLMKKFKALEIAACPFANLPEKKAGRWGAGLTAKKMADCRWGAVRTASIFMAATVVATATNAPSRPYPWSIAQNSSARSAPRAGSRSKSIALE